MWCNAASVLTWICTNKLWLSSKKRDVKYHNCRTCQRIIVFVCLCQCSEDEGRRMKRREKNRVAAQKSRKRQTQRADLLHEVGERISADQILIYALSRCVKHMALGSKVAHQKVYFWALNRFAKCCKYFLHCIFFLHEGLFCKSLRTDCVFETGCLRR